RGGGGRGGAPTPRAGPGWGAGFARCLGMLRDKEGAFRGARGPETGGGWPKKGHFSPGVLQTPRGPRPGGGGPSGARPAGEPMWRLEVTRYRVSPLGWPARMRLSIGVIADVHAGGPAMPVSRIASIVEATNALAPDLVVLLGDFAASHRLTTRSVSADQWSAALSRLTPPLGVHAILGNHDWWDDRDAQRAGRGPVLGRRKLEAVGIPVYENDAILLA